MSAKSVVIFFAIPCGEFYSVQADIIRRVCRIAGITADIVEDDPSTKGLWDKITSRIDAADYFVADITSQSQNIVVELGYAIARKPIERIAVLIADYKMVPSDLGGLIVQKYSSLGTFQERLASWISCSVPRVRTRRIQGLTRDLADFQEDFQNQDAFLKRWYTPPWCSYLFTAEGLKFSGASIPILTTTLAILGDCEFKFTARIDKKTIGWVVKGTTPPDLPVPAFFVMFNLSQEGHLLPHIWTIKDLQEGTGYHVYNDQAVKVGITKSEDGWFTLMTRVRGDVVEILNSDSVIFETDFSKPPYAEAYDSVAPKMGQVGFRCHPGEVATVRRVGVRGI